MIRVQAQRRLHLNACIALISISSLSIGVTAIAAGLPGDPVRGAQIYAANCGACHSLDTNRVGPSHRGVLGRKAGSVPGYDYSSALRRTRFTWTAQNLDRWLTNPLAMVPGTKMGFRLSDPGKRADVIAYLRQQSAAEHR